MKRLMALFVAVAFVAGLSGYAVGQTTQPAPKMEPKKVEKKMPAKNANGTVKSASADSVVVAGKEKNKDMEWTFAVDPKTKIKKAGKDVAAAELKPGDSVHVRYLEHDGKSVAQAITVRGGSMAKKAATPEKK